jgi:protein tyrosine phosphatase (PTP) superfamily phosphohydrolase (DUF442 family)
MKNLEKLEDKAREIVLQFCEVSTRGEALEAIKQLINDTVRETIQEIDEIAQAGREKIMMNIPDQEVKQLNN